MDELLQLLKASKKDRNAEWMERANQSVVCLSREFNELSAHWQEAGDQLIFLNAISRAALLKLAKAYGVPEAKRRVQKRPETQTNVVLPKVCEITQDTDLQVPLIQIFSDWKLDLGDEYILLEVIHAKSGAVIEELINLLVGPNKNYARALDRISSGLIQPKLYSASEWFNFVVKKITQDNKRKNCVIDEKIICAVVRFYSGMKLADKKSQRVLEDLVNKGMNDAPTLFLSSNLIDVIALFKRHFTKTFLERLGSKRVELLWAVAKNFQVKKENYLEDQFLQSRILFESQHSFEKFLNLHESFSLFIKSGNSEGNDEFNERLCDRLIDIKLYVMALPFTELSVNAKTQLESQIDSLFDGLNVEVLGAVTEVLEFKPSQQILLHPQQVQVSEVRVVRPGFGIRRENGSLKVLKKAVVEVTNE